jgi:methionyl-tRNA formyltransferase
MRTKGDITAVIFGDPSLMKTRILTERALLLAKHVEGFHVAAVCDSAKYAPSSHLFPTAQYILKSLMKRLFDPTRKLFIRKEMFKSMGDIGKRYHVDAIVPPRRSINDPAFTSYLKDRLKPSIGLSFGCPQVFCKELLNVFERVVNVHSGILPDYQGVNTTAWSVYCGERTTGYTYHYMTEKIDRGPILASGEVKVCDRSIIELEYEKANLAAAQLATVLGAALRGEKGTTQGEKGRYFGIKASRKIRIIDRPSEITWNEYQRRMHAFGTLWIRLGGELLEVTRLKSLRTFGSSGMEHTFVTADDVLVAAFRFGFLPLSMFRVIPRWAYPS